MARIPASSRFDRVRYRRHVLRATILPPLRDGDYALLVFALENTRSLTPKQRIRMPTTSAA